MPWSCTSKYWSEKRRKAIADGQIFGLTNSDASVLQEYTKLCSPQMAFLITRELGLGTTIEIPDDPNDACDLLAAPATPTLPTSRPGSSSGQATAPPYFPVVPPGMENLPNFDRKMLVSNVEILLKNTGYMSDDDITQLVEEKCGQNAGLVKVRRVSGGNVTFIRFWTAKHTEEAIAKPEEQNNWEKAVERSTFKEKHHTMKEKMVNPDWKGWANARNTAPQEHLVGMQTFQ